MLLAAAMLPALSQVQTVNICGRTPQVRDAIMRNLEADDCAAVESERLARIDELDIVGFSSPRITALQAGDFAGLTGLQHLILEGHGLRTLPEGVFNGLTSLRNLHLVSNPLEALPEGVFNGLTRLQTLHLHSNELTTLPAGVFDGLTDLVVLILNFNQLTALPAGVFDDLTSLQHLYLRGNQLPTLPAGVFGNLTSLQTLHLHENELTTLPAGVFDNLTSLQTLHLWHNHLVGLTENDPLFARLPSGVELLIDYQTETPGQPTQPEPGQPEEPEQPETPSDGLTAAVPLMVSASDSMRQGFVRIINESEETGSVRILAFDDGGTAANPIEIQLEAMQAFHFNAGDLENGNADKGINAGVGSPMRGDWRLDIETALPVRVLSFVRTTDGFLTAMGDVLLRNAGGRLVAQTFNPGRNANQVSKLRLVNTGANAERVSIEGVDDRGDRGGPVILTLAAGESRTLTAFDLENGAQGLRGTLGDGAGKWRLFITAGQAVVGVSLLEAASGHLTNISTMGVATEGQ